MAAKPRNWIYLEPGKDGHYPLGAWFLMIAPTGDNGRTYGFVSKTTITKNFDTPFCYRRFSPNREVKGAAGVGYVKTLEEAQKLVEEYADKYPKRICTDCDGVGYITEPKPRFERCKSCNSKGTFYLDEKYN